MHRTCPLLDRLCGFSLFFENRRFNRSTMPFKFQRQYFFLSCFVCVGLAGRSGLPNLPNGNSDQKKKNYLNNRVFLSRNYRLIVAPRKFDVLKTNICPRSEASRANMLVLRTSNFQGATIRPRVPRHKHSIVFIVHH